MVVNKTEVKPKRICPQQGEFIKNGKRYVRVITHDTVRDLIIPDYKPNVNAAVFYPDEIQELANRPKDFINTDEETKRLTRTSKEEEAAKSALRKKELQNFPIYKEYGQRLNKLEQEAEAKANFLLNRAKEIRQEDEDDIKLCNKLILGTKCQAIRDAQVAEKITINKEMAAEEKRLDDMMEQERRRLLAKEALDKKREEDKKNAYKKAITEQVIGNELEREMEAERIIEETKLMNDASLQAQIDELKEIQKRTEEKGKIRKELNRINKSMLEMAEMEKRQAKLADLKIQQFMKQKADMEKKREDDYMRSRYEKELELAKLRAMQQKSQDAQALKDAARAKRIQEQYEKEWREKEKAVQLEKRRKNEQLKLDRLKQMEEKKIVQAIEAEKEELEKKRLALIEQAISTKEKQDEFKKREELNAYRASLLKQINEKEVERIKMRQAMFQDGVSTNLEIKNHSESIKATIKKKINTIRYLVLEIFKSYQT